MSVVSTKPLKDPSGGSGMHMSPGLWLSQYSRYESEKLLSKEDMDDLVILSRKGHKSATNRLIASMLGLLMKRARSQTSDQNEIVDLLNEGVCGIIVAIERFDLSRGIKFITYADFWIRHYMNEHAMSLHAVYAPARTRKLEKKVGRVTRELAQRLGRNPSTLEISKELDLDESVIGTIQQLGQFVSSSDTPVDENESVVAEFLEAPLPDYEVDIDHERIMVLVGEALEQLKPEVRAVVEQAMGIGCEERSYVDIGKDLGVGRQAAHQQAKRGLTKIKKYLLSRGVGSDVLKMMPS